MFNVRNAALIALSFVIFGCACASDRKSGNRTEGENKIPDIFSALPLQHAIKTVKGDGTRYLVVFSDPDCPYCKRLERETLSKLDNITIFTFLFPLEKVSAKLTPPTQS